MKLTVEEIPDPRCHRPCIMCGEQPRYLAVIPDAHRAGVRGAITLCNACANEKEVLKLIEETADSLKSD